MSTINLQDRAMGAIMGAYIGDALGLGPHWFYDLNEQYRLYGDWINDYTDPQPDRYHAGMKAGQQSQSGLILNMQIDSILPESTVVAMISRDGNVISPRGSTLLQAEDQLFIILKPHTRIFVDCVFSGKTYGEKNELSTQELRVKGNTKITDIASSYNIDIVGAAQDTLEQVIRSTLNTLPNIDAVVELGDVKLYVRDMVAQRIITVGVLVTGDKLKALN
ncbi:MAG: hypothetical protein AXW17_10615 [Colwellia sp. Phe_37]|nr:MAG: hypothetical protein AXW17_10615 [Colwellia sp. Phe_37]